MLTSRVNSQHDLGGGVWPLYEHENLHFDNEQDIHVVNGYGHNLDLLFVLH